MATIPFIIHPCALKPPHALPDTFPRGAGVTHAQFQGAFPSEKEAISHFIRSRYGEGLRCPHCGSRKGVRLSRARYVSCPSCRSSYSVFSGTIFHRSHVPLLTWFRAINSFLNGRKGLSACHLQRETGLTYKTAWRVLHLIRTAMGNTEKRLFTGTVEVDETYMGGRPRFRSPSSRRGRGTRKTPVVGMAERGTGRVYAQVMLPGAEGKPLSRASLHGFIRARAEPGSTVMTDSFPAYRGLGKQYTHKTVDHSSRQYSDGRGTHTNTIENFWGLLKRGILGVYHWVSRKHLQKYVDESCFRASYRRDPDIFGRLLRQCVLEGAA